ncbi:multiple epidermal growth factor-like domains protein 10 [Haliotis asinina]|uniref:multiple epidermal growth factor-like domains protein 10 n=1 Tax=Haliotis asinina TaxID=109174 RepID=UPI003531A671
MSTTRQISQSAAKAVDGVTTAVNETYSVHTSVYEATAWWKVDLQTPVQSPLVNIYFRTDYKRRRNGLQLFNSMTNSSDPKEGDLCHTVIGRGDGTDIPDILNVTCPGTWRYLTVYTETDNDGAGAALDFVEVQVWICDPGYYGAKCVHRCVARHCKMDSSCDFAGRCVDGCMAGYLGKDCTQVCPRGRYGEGCNKNCSSQCKPSSNTCDHVTGRCPNGCTAGYTGDDCLQICSTGMYGEGCSKTCSNRHCKPPSNTCHHVTGTCPDGCTAGYRGDDCSQTCASGVTYGDRCSKTCNSRHCVNNMASCPRNTGACSSAGCQPGWAGTDCTACATPYYGANCDQSCAARHCKDYLAVSSEMTCRRQSAFKGLGLGLELAGGICWN